MKACAKCGAQLEDFAAFCNECGSPVGAAAMPQAVNTQAPVGKRSYDEAIALYKAGRFDEAVPLFQSLADQGSARAQNKLGECYYNGDGVGYNEMKALEWFMKAAKKGNADAFAKLGECYELGNGVRQDLDNAAKWYRKAAKQGNTDAQVKYDEITRKKNLAKKSLSPSSSSSYDDHGGFGGMFLLGFLAILPKLIRFVVIPIIIIFLLFSFIKYIKTLPERLFGKLDSVLEQVLSEDVTGKTAEDTATVTADTANIGE
jgi:TPR repeat protein